MFELKNHVGSLLLVVFFCVCCVCVSYVEVRFSLFLRF